MARYIMEEMPDIRKTGKRITYPKFARIDNASIKELARRVGDVSGFSAGDIEGVLLQTAATKELKQWADLPESGIDIAGRGSHRVYVKKKVATE